MPFVPKNLVSSLPVKGNTNKVAYELPGMAAGRHGASKRLPGRKKYSHSAARDQFARDFEEMIQWLDSLFDRGRFRALSADCAGAK